MIEAAVSARGMAGTRLLIGPGRGGSRVLTVGSAHEESSASPSIQTCTASWRDGESFDGDHHPTAGRTRRQGHTGGRVVGGGRRHRRWIRTERVPAAWQCLGAAARRQEAVEANPDEALREHVEAEAAEEFLRAERHQSDPTPVAIVLPPKRHLVLGDGDEPMVGDRDPVGVPREIVQHVTGAAERGLGVDDPVVVKEGAKPRAQRRARR